jgi:hypothetical protein
MRGDLLVSEYPKSGGSWIASMVGDGLDLPFPRNRMPTVRRCILHGHLLPGPRRPRTLVVWRDGRDVIVSWYFHCLFMNERENHDLVRETRRVFPVVDPEDVRANLPRFIEFAFDRQPHPGFSWSAFVSAWADAPQALHTSYEAMRADPEAELGRVLDELGARVDRRRVADIVERHSFARVAGRAAGTEARDSFLRKGVVGDWMNHFSAEARRVFDDRAGDALIRLGYESDRAWADAG